MSKKRTKKQKMRTQYHYALPTSHSFSGLEIPRDQKIDTSASLYSYDPRLITKDIIKTVVISMIILLIQAVLYIYYR